MTRVSHSGAHGAHGPSTLDRPRAVSKKKKKPYKIVLEAVTQEKRKLQSIMTYHDQAPRGFGYIPVGFPEFTEWCKEQCRQRNLDVHIVSAKPKSRIHADPEKISHHVHRIGHHFPLDIIDLACSKFGYSFNDESGLKKQRASPIYGDEYFEWGIANYQSRQGLHGRPLIDSGSKDHIRGAVREMFPKIPEADLTSIVNHAFKEGTNRVGNAKELSLARRVQLAVVAHIRHTYTEYDQILKTKTGSWTEARQKVEHVSLAKLKEWRDEAGQVSHELEETFREVIVLDDDDSSDDDIPTSNTRASSMEIVSSRATARDLQPEPIDLTHKNASRPSRVSRRTVILQPMLSSSHSSFPRGSLNTHHALQTFRADPRAPPPPVTSVEPLRVLQHEPFPVAYNKPFDQRGGGREPARPELRPMQMRDANGRLYNLQPIEEPRREERMRPFDGPFTPVYDHAPTAAVRHAGEVVPSRLTSQPSRPVLASSSRRASDQDIVLPSVERDPGVAPEAPSHERRRGDSVSYVDAQTPKRKSFPSSIYSPQERYPEQTTKRSRPVYDDAYAQAVPRARYEPTNLTFSPMRPANGGQRDYYAVPSSQPYVLAPARDLPRGHIPEYDRPSGTRVLVPVEYSATRREPARYPAESGHYRLQ